MNRIKPSNYIPHLTFEEIECRIQKKPVLLLPIGSSEPIGASCPLGLINKVTKHLSFSIADKSQILISSVQPFGYSMAARSFAGAMSVNRSSFESYLRQIFASVHQWGIQQVFIFNSGYWQYTQLQNIIRRRGKNRKQPSNIYEFKGMRIHIVSWQHDTNMRSYFNALHNSPSLGQCEFELISMGYYICPEIMTNYFKQENYHCQVKQEQFERWKKRGNDPEKYRKIFPLATTLNLHENPNGKVGKDIFDYIVNHTVHYIDKYSCDGKH